MELKFCAHWLLSNDEDNDDDDDRIAPSRPPSGLYFLSSLRQRRGKTSAHAHGLSEKAQKKRVAHHFGRKGGVTQKKRKQGAN